VGVCAGLDEWHQSFQPGRTTLVSDVVIDACGDCFICCADLFTRDTSA
jgi:VanZ family protein